MLTFSRKNAWIFAGIFILTASQIAFAQNAAPANGAGASRIDPAKTARTSAIDPGAAKATEAAAKKKQAEVKAAADAKAAKSKTEKAAADKKSTEKKIEPAKAATAKKAEAKKVESKKVESKKAEAKKAETRTAAKPAPAGKAAIAAPAASPTPELPEQNDDESAEASTDKAAGEKTSAEGTKTAATGAGETKGWKRVNVPLPPVLDKQLRIAAAKADAEKAKAATKTAAADPKSKNEVARLGNKAPEIVPVAPPEPRKTGIFALFEAAGTAQSQDDNNPARQIPASASSFARVEGPSTKLASLNTTNPLRSRKPKRGLQEDDDEEEGGGSEGGGGFGSGFAGVDKQVDSVQTACLKPQLVAMIQQAGRHFGGTPIITSGYRNRGRRGSYHRRCAAADFQIAGVSSAQIVSYLRQLPGAGGVGTYCHTKSVHLDTGQPRDWHQCLFTRRFALRAPIVAAGQ